MLCSDRMLVIEGFRSVGPGSSSPFHFDGIYMNRLGTADQMEPGEEIGGRQHTVWVPWSDVPIGESGLCVIEGSHNLPGFAGLRDTLGKVDVNYTDISGGFHFTDPLEVLAYDSGSRLLTEDFSAGDVSSQAIRLLVVCGPILSGCLCFYHIGGDLRNVHAARQVSALSSPPISAHFGVSSGLIFGHKSGSCAHCNHAFQKPLDTA